MAIDEHGHPIYFKIIGSQIHNVKAAPSLIDKIKEPDTVITDEALREQIKRT